MKKIIATALMTTALTTSAFAGGHEIAEFRIGILGGENAQDRLASNQCLATYIEEALGVPVRMFTPADYNGVMQGLLGGTLDLAWLGPSAYAGVFVDDPEAIEPILVKTNLDGSYTYYSIGFARSDSDITSLDDMKGKVFGFGDPNSGSGYLIPSVEIPEATGATMQSGDYFGEVTFTGGHEQTIVAVVNGDVDAGVTWADGLGNWEDGFNSGALRKAVDSGLIDMNDLVEIWRSKPIAEGPIVMRQAMPDDIKQTVTELMMGLHERDADCAYGVAAGETAGFIPITHEAYETIVALRLAEVNN